jgi:hypothetical protein
MKRMIITLMAYTINNAVIRGGATIVGKAIGRMLE